MDKIPASLKKYIKKVRANRRENKISQSSKQVVIINQESKRRRSSKKSTGGSGKENQYPRIVYIPQSTPNMSIPMNQPQQISQPIPQAINQFAQTPVYRNPLRNEPFRTALNPPPFSENKPIPSNMEQNIFTQPPQVPQPVLPDIILEPNRIFMPSTPAQAYPITPGGSIFQGFVENQAVNQLNEQVTKEVNAFEDYGGLDAQSDTERLRVGKQLSLGEYYQTQMSQPLSNQQQDSLLLYFVNKMDPSDKKPLSKNDQKRYNEGERLANNLSANPQVRAIRDHVRQQLG